MAVLMLTGMMWIGLQPALCQEPQVPRVDQRLSPDKEKRIQELRALSVPAVFERLRAAEFFDDGEYLDKAIYTAFGPRSPEALKAALGYVRSTQIQTNPDASQNLYLAKRFFQIFPEESLESLLNLYESSGPKVRRNVLYAAGQMAGGESVKALLMHALNDGAYCEETTAESIGEPLRVCDVAYNQLVIRYDIPNVLRTIGTIHSIQVRDYHIGKLKNLL
jgi:hypothetical protein